MLLSSIVVSSIVSTSSGMETGKLWPTEGWCTIIGLLNNRVHEARYHSRNTIEE
jgi:hypothetical protein